jgi:hypothetical protein
MAVPRVRKYVMLLGTCDMAVLRIQIMSCYWGEVGYGSTNSCIKNVIFLLLYEATLLDKWIQTFRRTANVECDFER